MADKTGGERSNADFVRSLARGLAVIRAFSTDRPSLTLSEVAEEAGMTRAAARRFLLTLVELGYVSVSNGRYSLRARVLELGYAYLSNLSLTDVAIPRMEALVAQLNESCSMSVLDDTDIVYVARVPTQRIMSITLAVGTRLPAYATSMGRVLLAGLTVDELEERLSRVELEPLTPNTLRTLDELRDAINKARNEGFATVDEELEEGLRSLAVPIRNPTGTTIAALNTGVHTNRGSMSTLRHDFLPVLFETAWEIEADLGKTRSAWSA